MAAELKMVTNDDALTITGDMIAAALERRKAGAATPLAHYDEEIGGTFTYRKLTGAEVRECRKLATVDLGKQSQRVDQDKLEFLIVNKATAEPKVTSALWGQLGQLGPLVQAGLSAAVFTACGLLGDPTEAAGKSSTESQS